jgi:hypothetical protein
MSKFHDIKIAQFIAEVINDKSEKKFKYCTPIGDAMVTIKFEPRCNRIYPEKNCVIFDEIEVWEGKKDENQSND